MTASDHDMAEFDGVTSMSNDLSVLTIRNHVKRAISLDT